MIEPLAAAWEVGSFLEQHSLLKTPLETGAASLVRLITGRFQSRSADPIGFALATRMVLIRADNGVEVDLSLALPGYEDELFRRAIPCEVEPGKTIRLCSAEDLIIHKAVAGRPQDLIDIQSVVDRQGQKLEAAYIREWLAEFSNLLDNPQILRRFESAWRASQQEQNMPDPSP
ncbi:MAG: hypothetical protein HY784_08205 [Chloroflexi bacterium]|nr:hypothetical protein [Chloroflexota bacterium]